MGSVPQLHFASIDAAVSQFRAAIEATGLTPPEIVADGVLRRFDADDEKKGKKSAWYILYGEGVPAGAFGNWKTGHSEKWCGKSDQALTPTERTDHLAKIARAKQEAEATQLQLQAEAAAKCVRIFGSALDATDDNPYCVRKGIKPYGLKEFKDKRTLLVPMRDSHGALRSLQFIDADGAKRFKSNGRVQGSYYSFGGRPKDTVLVCEGFATGASLHAATGHPIAVAFHAGNLEAVARAIRAKLPHVRIIICADNDRFNASGNVGVDHATDAARAVSGWLAVPQFVSDDGAPTDFNDLAQREGNAALVTAVMQASYLGTEKGEVARPTPPARRADDRAAAQDNVRRVKIRCGASIRPQAITWLWPGWLPAGKLTILAGAAGTGKTTLALALAAVITAGGRWPDGTVSKSKGNVLIWSSEDVADDTLVPRLIASGADLARCHFIEGIAQNGESVPFDPSQDIVELHRAAEAMGGVSLLLIDPIVSAVAGDMHRANDVRRSLQAVVDFAEAHNCAVVGITHFAKGGAGKAPQDRVIGSQAFGALARMVLVTAKEEDGSRRVLARAKSNIAADDGGVAYSIEASTLDGGIETTHAIWDGVIEGTAREILGEVEIDDNSDVDTRDELKRMLTDTLKDAGGTMPTKALQAEVRDAGHSWDVAKRLKKEMGIESVKLSMGGPWVWRLPQAGQVPTPEGSTKSVEECTQKNVLPSVNLLPSALPSTVLDAGAASASDAPAVTSEVI
ncbi:AAA family ATPase [Massilia sp. YMA4]|uniref:AAA family ATPase n=1 Tax=Massilia sp. YMA4 TaxID=1593482 RepID=UPI000DD0F2BB|nr:AAA family ATPase [Massilia sp. YMA4]AXA92711.1 topoisomerase [Massilia sp. YMA4]